MKCVALTIVFLLASGFLPLVGAAPGVLAPSQVDTHGPLLDRVTFASISADSTLYNSLVGGTIQGPEWTFSTGSFLSAKTNTNLYANTTTTYNFEGFAFNMLRPVTSNVHFRRAIIDLLDYAFIQSTVLSGISGSAQPDLFYSGVYPTVYNPNVRTYTGSLSAAVTELKAAGLTAGNATAVAPSQITWLYNGAPFNPNLIYRSDDPVRSGLATHLVFQASKVGLQFNAKGVAQAGGVIFGPSFGAALKPGLYDQSTGYNTPPTFNYSAAKTTDTWDVYTFGWIVSPNFNWAWSFFNSQNVASTNFGNYYNRTMDYDTNKLEYASSLSAATDAAKKVATDFMDDLPYINTFYTSYLYSVYIKGWSGYADLPTTGPMETTGLYYSLLNLHPVSQTVGTTFGLAIHNIPESLNPLYGTNWVWQTDIWSEVYDTPLATSPTEVTRPLSYMNWMTTSYSTSPFTGITGTGPGWFSFQGSNTPHKIANGAVITFDFSKNITFTDHVQMTAYDYNYSLWAWNVAGNLPDSYSPVGSSLAGPSGLWATYINPGNSYEIKIYINSSSVWNLANVVLAVLPLHIFKYFNPDQISTGRAVMDTTQPFDQATSPTACGAACAFLARGVTRANVPSWLRYLPNLEVGQGPFWLRAYSGSTGAGELDRNVNFYRSAWMKNGDIINQGSLYNFSTSVQESIYNPGSSSFGGVAPGQVGNVPVTNASGTASILTAKGSQVQRAPLSASSNGVYSASLDTRSLAPGQYEVVTNASYAFLGLTRTWYQATGLMIRPAQATTTSTTVTTTITSTSSTSIPTTTTSSTSSSSPQTTTAAGGGGSNATLAIVGAIVVFIIIIAVALFLRRGRGRV